jgi:hypothetical protein
VVTAQKVCLSRTRSIMPIYSTNSQFHFERTKMNKKSLILICCALLFVTCQLRVAMASTPNETTMTTTTTTTTTTTVTDSKQWHTVESWTMRVTTTGSVSLDPQPETPDDGSDSPTDYTPLIIMLYVFLGAGTILGIWKKHRAYCRLPSPLETPQR